MGADIHMYVEYTYKKDIERYKKEIKENKKDIRKPYVHSFCDHLNPGRNYLLFGCLSDGVRTDVDGAFEPKGPLSKDESGYMSHCDNILYITETGEGEGECTLEQALSWGKEITYLDYEKTKPVYTQHPDWHSHSWLSLKEYTQAIELFNKNKDSDDYNVGIEYLAVRDLMKSLKKNGAIPRIVFWFDN